MWTEEYLNKIIERTNSRINTLSQKLVDVKPGRQMPEEDQVTIGSGRQMEVAVLFLDICNYSSWFNDTFEYQKIVLAIMNIFMAEMMNIVRDYKGEFEKNTGDGLMAYFGCETNNPTECVSSAIDAALTMHYFNDNLLTPYMFRQGAQAKLEFRIGIDYGKVTIGRVGVPGGLNSFVAIGTSANIACKLLKISNPGDIIIGQHVRNNLLEYRKQNCVWITLPTGFEYIISKAPYWAYRYTGSWKHPQNLITCVGEDSLKKENQTQETSSSESKETKEFQEDIDKLKPVDLFKQKDTGTPEIKVSEEKKYSDIAKEIASSIREYISVYISLADAKAGILIGVNSGLLAALYFHGPKLFQKAINMWGVSDVISFLGYLFLVGGIYSALLVVWPRTSSVKQKGLISWIHVSNYNKVEAYIQDIFSANESQIVENLYRLNYDLAIICKRKYYWLSSAFKLTVIGCIISIVVFIVISRPGI